MLYVNPLATSRALESGALPETPERREFALKELEQYFVFTLLQEMRKSIPEDGLFGDGMANEIYNEMLDDALSGEIAESGQFGIAKLIEDQLRIADLQRQLKASDPSRMPTAG